MKCKVPQSWSTPDYKADNVFDAFFPPPSSSSSTHSPPTTPFNNQRAETTIVQSNPIVNLSTTTKVLMFIIALLASVFCCFALTKCIRKRNERAIRPHPHRHRPPTNENEEIELIGVGVGARFPRRSGTNHLGFLDEALYKRYLNSIKKSAEEQKLAPPVDTSHLADLETESSNDSSV